MKRILSILLTVVLLGVSCIVPTLASEPATWMYDFNNGEVPASSSLKSQRKTSSLTASVQDGQLSLSGTIDSSVTQTNTYISFYIPVDGLKVDTEYSVSGKYKLTNGTINSLMFGSFGGAGLSGTNGAAYSNNYKPINNKSTSVMNDFAVFSGKFTTTSTTASGKTGVDNTNPEYLIIGMYSAAISPDTTITLLVDDLAFAEATNDKIEVKAVSSDEAMGKATVTKYNSSSTDFVKGEDAVFSAIPTDGYEFTNWTDENGNSISGKTSYLASNLSDNLTLTANFKKADYLSVVYDYESNALNSEIFGNTKRYTWRHLGSFNTTDAIEGGTSYQISQDPEFIDQSGVRRGYLAEDTAYMLKAGNVYHITLSYKALERSNTNLGISLAAITGEPKSDIRDKKLLTSAGKEAIFYVSSENLTNVQFVVTPQSDGYLAYYTTNIVDFTLLIDNITITEVIDDTDGNSLVTAVTDAQMGDVTVTNSVDAFGDLIARGESAIFNATAKEGYSFKEWQDANGNTVSNNRAYQIDNVQEPVTLIAVFEKLAEGEVQDGQYVIDFEVTPNATFRDNRADATSTAVIVTDGINGKSLEFTAEYNEKDNHYTSYFIKMNGLKANAVYDVKGKYQVTDGALPTLRVGLIAFNSGATQGYTQSGEYLAVTTSTPVMSEAAEFNGFIQTDQTDAPIYLVISTSTVNKVTFRIDDIELSESNYQPFYGHGDEPKKETVINFDDYYITTTRPNQIRVDAAPARDGVETDALHILPTTDLGPAILNWGTTTTNRDRWFTVPVKENTLYKWSMWVYIPSISSTWAGNIPYMNYWIDYQTNTAISLKYMEERDEWVKLERTFTTKPGQTKISMTFNAGEEPKEMWLDDFRITEIDPGTMVATDLSYCEEPYNLLAKQEQYSDILAGKSGVYEIKTDPSAQYTFGVTTVGGNSGSKVYLSFDGKTVMPQSEANAPFAFVNANATRLGTELVSASSGVMYLVIENPDNSMQIENIQLFKTKSIGTDRDMGYETDPNLPDPVLTVEKLLPIGEEYEASPATGDYSAVLPAMIIAITALITILLIEFLRKERF